MTKETAELNRFCYFWIGSRRCQVLSADTFGNTLHYGFHTVDDGRLVVGWIPCEFVGGCELTK